jgi:DNA-binding XRE family transcriptional regulator
MIGLYGCGLGLAFRKNRTGRVDFAFRKDERWIMKPSSMTVAQYRAKRELTLEAFAAALGKSKSHLCEIEASNSCSAKLALAIEAHSGGLVDAATLNPEVALARKLVA